MRKPAVAPSSPRRPTNVTLPEALLADARSLGINVSQACERGVAAAVADAKAQRWLRENGEAIEAWNGYIEQHGVPFAEFSQV